MSASLALVALLLLCSLAAAPTAPADVGIDASWGNLSTGNQTQGGLFSSQPRGIAFDSDRDRVYAADSANRRIQVFTGAGQFIAAWGRNVDATNPSTGYEKCLAPIGSEADHCKAGEAGVLGGEFSEPAGMAIDRSTGNLYVIDTGNRRVQEFDPDGNFIRAFGQDVVFSGGEGFEVCEVASACKAGVTGATGGAFGAFGGNGEASNVFSSGLTVAPPGAPNAGNVLVADAGNVRVQEFRPDGVFVRAFGWDVVASGPGNRNFASGPDQASEVQAVKVSAIAGQFKLKFGAGGTGVAETGNLAFNAGAAEVQAALNALANVSAGGGSVTVSGGPGDAEGSVPYRVSFDGGPLAGTDVVQMTATNVGLAGGSPSSAVAVTTPLPGNSGFEVCNASSSDVCQAGTPGSGVGEFVAKTPTRVAEDPAGRLYTVEPEGSYRVQRFLLSAGAVTPQGEFAGAALHGSATNGNAVKDNTTEIGVSDNGDVYVVKAFKQGTGAPPIIDLPNSLTRWQQRVLRLSPSTGAVLETLAANAGPSPAGTNYSFSNVRSLAVGPTGSPLYATTATGFSLTVGRVFRLGNIQGLGATEIGARDVSASSAKLQARITPAVSQLSTVYRFEYSDDGVTWLAVPSADVEIGNGSTAGESSNCPTPPAAACEVTQAIAGLTPNTTYRVRLVLASIFNRGAPLTLEGDPFTTVADPPRATTGTAFWSSPPQSAPSLLLGGTVNPGRAAATYYFQYVDAAHYQPGAEDPYAAGSVVPLTPAEAGNGSEDVAVRQALAGLDPSLTYHYRLVAVNSVGVEKGTDRTVDPPSANDRFYELVSDGDTGGMGTGEELLAVSDDGNRVVFVAQAFDQPKSIPYPRSDVIGARGAERWRGVQVTPEPEGASARGAGIPKLIGSDLASALFREASVGEYERFEVHFGHSQIGTGDSEEVFRLAPLRSTGSSGAYSLETGSRDLSTFVFSFAGDLNSAVTLLPGESMTAGERSNLYQVSGPPYRLTVVNRADGAAGAIIGGRCGAGLGGKARSGSANPLGQGNAVSADGSVVYFSSHPSAPTAGACVESSPLRLYKRIDDVTTVEVSAPQCSPGPACPGGPDGDDRFVGASVDGSVVFFISNRRLVNSDTDSTSDLYVYDESPPPGQPKLTQASAGLTVPGHAAGSGALVKGMVDNAADGSRAYFVAEGVLSGANREGRLPVVGGQNIYIYERDDAHPQGRIEFLASAAAGTSSGDEKEWSSDAGGNRVSSAMPANGSEDDGHLLLFYSIARLTTADTDGSRDLYRYDDEAGQLVCLSCAGPGGRGNGAFEVRAPVRPISYVRPNQAQMNRGASVDGSVFVFGTKEALLDGDENQTWDVYAWEALGTGGCTEAASDPIHAYVPAAAGCLDLVTAGTEGFGIPEGIGLNQTQVSPDGRNVFFATAAPLVAKDTNGALDIYDARIGGGFPDAVAPEACTAEAACQGAAPPTPPAPPALGSSTFSGPGNVASPPACRKGEVRRHGKCVKKHRHGKRRGGGKKSDKRADSDKGGRR